MRRANRDIRPGDRRIDSRMIALGVVGFLALATAFFFLGLLCIGPMVRSRLQTPKEVPQSPAYAPAEADRETSAADKNEEPELDVEITERSGEDGEQTTESSPDSDVRQDEQSLTLTLRPEGREKSSSGRSGTQPGEPEAPKKRPAGADTGIERPRAATERTHPPASSSSVTSTFRVQAGTFAIRTNAENLAADLSNRGYKAEIVTVPSEDRTLYRVQLSGYKTREGAEELAKDLSAKGYTPTVIADEKDD